MKFVVLTFLVVLPLCTEAALLGSMQSWVFMQSVGGISVGIPQAVKGGWSLPVNCDVTGLRVITVKPTSGNSALVWAATDVEINGTEIDLTIETGLAGVAGKSPVCGPADLHDLKDGAYSVFYRDPNGATHAIGNIRIANK